MVEIQQQVVVRLVSGTRKEEIDILTLLPTLSLSLVLKSGKVSQFVSCLSKASDKQVTSYIDLRIRLKPRLISSPVSFKASHTSSLVSATACVNGS